MGVIRTDKWMIDSYDDPINLCKRLRPLFNYEDASSIHEFLIQHGMYRNPEDDGLSKINDFQKREIWRNVQKEFRTLQSLWGGPNIPIFIFPSDSSHRKLMLDYNGKSGLAFIDKVFLFISEKNSVKEIKSLLTHEYHHVCRLSKYKKPEKKYHLLDTIILEGLAEHAVLERLGKEYLGNWTSLYTNEQLKRMWDRIILPNYDLPKHHPKHPLLLYGQRTYPQMIGYSTGFYLVQNYVREYASKTKDLFTLSSELIAQINESPYH